MNLSFALPVLMFIGLVVVAIWAYTAYCQYVIAQKIGTPYAWLSWIPVVSAVYLMYMAKFQWWLIVGVVLAFIVGGSNKNLGIFSLAGTIGLLFAYAKIMEFRHRPRWWAILMIIPIVNWIILYHVAFKEPEGGTPSSPSGQLPPTETTTPPQNPTAAA